MFTPEKVEAVDDNGLNEKEENMAYIYLSTFRKFSPVKRKHCDYNDAIYT